MAYTVTSPQFSFVSFNAQPDSCEDNPQLCLPVQALTDLQFMVTVAVTGADRATWGATLFAISISGLGNLDFEAEFLPTWETISTGIGLTDYYQGYFSAAGGMTAVFDALNVGDCFTLSFYKYDAGLPHHAVVHMQTGTTCFIKSNDCYTSVLSYNNNENAFDFTYILGTFNAATSNWYNSIRLAFYLHSPVNPEEEKNYQKSDGSTVKLMHRVWKDYKFKTAGWTADIHEKFAIATAHDNILITSDYAGVTAESFTRIEKIEINWQQDNTPEVNWAIGKGVLRMAAPRAYVNSNCS